MGSPFENLRKRFPQALFMESRGESYLDSASTSLKIDIVGKTLKRFYDKEASNVHRGEHHLSLKATEGYEKARASTADFLGAGDPSEIVFSSGATEGLNLLAETLSLPLQPGDQILITAMEHHSNFLPWRAVAEKQRLDLQIAPVDKEGVLDKNQMLRLIGPKTKIVSLTHVSNVTGVINPLRDIISKAKKMGALTVIDAAQSAPLLPLNVKQMDCDFLVFSGHKIFSPAGIGALYGKKKLWDKMPPWKKGGGMIFEVFEDGQAKWADPPQRFEAGTPFIEGALALGEVLSFLKKECEFQEIFPWEKALAKMADDRLSRIPGLRVIGRGGESSNILSFTVEGLVSSDIAFILSQQKLAVRAGHHCCMPLMQSLGLRSGAVRASFSVYNQEKDVTALEKAVLKALEILRE